MDRAVVIRPVVAADSTAVLALWRAVFPEYADLTRPQRDPAASIARKLAVGDGLFWLAEAETAAVVGTIMAGWDGHRGWLYSLGVAPAVRRRGIARRLVRHAEDALAALGCPKINLQVLTGNAAALAFYHSLGYAPDAVTSLGRRLG